MSAARASRTSCILLPIAAVSVDRSSGSGQTIHATQGRGAAPAANGIEADHLHVVTHQSLVSPAELRIDQNRTANQRLGVDPQLIKTIQYEHRSREDYLKLCNATILRAKAICRRWADGDKVKGNALYNRLFKLRKGIAKTQAKAAKNGGKPALPDATTQELENLVYLACHFQTIEATAALIKKHERNIERGAEQLPIREFILAVNGLGFLGCGQIIACAGDLNRYANPAKLWTRMGLGRVRVNGQWVNQRKSKDVKTANLMGYSPRRRSIMFSIGAALIKKQNEYHDLCDERKRIEREKVPPCGCPVKSEKPFFVQTHVKGCDKKGGTPKLWMMRAERYMVKRLLRDLWREWRAVVR